MVSEHVLFYKITPPLTRTREYLTTERSFPCSRCSIVTGSSATEHMLSPAQTVCLLQTTPPPLPLSPIMFYKCLGRHLAASGYHRSVRFALLLIDVLIAARCCSNKMSAELRPQRRGRARPPPFAARYDRRLANLLWPALDLSRFAVSAPRDRIVIYVLGRASRSRWVSAI